MNAIVRTILAAEDGENDQFILKLAFDEARLPCNLVTVCDGTKLVEYLTGAGIYANRAIYPLPALILLDLKMPCRDGFEVLAWLAKHSEFRELPAFVLSSSSDDSDIRKARALGARDYFVKPHALSDLVKILQRLQTWLVDQPRPLTPHRPVSPPSRCHG